MPPDSASLLPGTLDLLVLSVVSVQPEHGWGIGQRLLEVSRGVFEVNQGSLYPALQRLEKKGWIRSGWRMADSGRSARYYTITASGRRQLVRERRGWERQVEGIGLVLQWAT
jgi:transcriptional regulator